MDCLSQDLLVNASQLLMIAEKYVNGDYVLAPVKNAFNDRTSYWISKKGYLVAYYAFTPLDERNLHEMISEPSWNGLIKMFEEKIAA